jgi:UDP-N-acetyl-D-glucosamine dehydrogenase
VCRTPWRAAEATKLLENIFRSVNIALVNELKVVYSAMDIDIWEVIQAAKTKPFGFMPFYPGPGLGGHCIPIDPFYLTWKAREYGQTTRFIELAGEVNSAMPEYVIDRVNDALNAQRKAVNGAKILVLGLAYKPNVDDDRESPSYVLMDLLKKRGAEVAYYDPHVPVIRPSREHSHWAGIASIEWRSMFSNISMRWWWQPTMPSSIIRSWRIGPRALLTPGTSWPPSKHAPDRSGRPKSG